MRAESGKLQFVLGKGAPLRVSSLLFQVSGSFKWLEELTLLMAAL